MIEEIIKFNFENKEYIISKDEQGILFSIKELDEVRTKLSPKEEALIKTVYSLLVGKKEDYILLSNTTYRSMTFKTLVNKKNGLYSFLSNTNSKDEIEAIKELNYIFNNQNSFLNDNFSDEEEHRLADILHKAHVILKVSGIILAVSLSLKMTLYTLPHIPSNYPEFVADYHMDKIRVEHFSSKQKYDFHEIEDIIDGNSNLTEDEKEFCKKIKTILDENIDVINFETVKRHMRNLKINYCVSETESNHGTVGKYHVVGNKKYQIDLIPFESYPTKNFQTSNKIVLAHELQHALDDYGWLANLSDSQVTVVSNNELLYETFNELVLREYVSYFTTDEFVKAYQLYMPPTYVLCEILDEETIKNYKFKTDSYYITNYLSSLNIPLEDIYDFYRSFKELDILVKERDYEKLFQMTRHIYTLLDKFYRAKFGYGIDSDLIAMSYLYSSIFSTEEIDNTLDTYFNGQIYFVEPKGYVGKRFKKEHRGVKVYTDKGQEYLITEENRLITYNRKNDTNEKRY